MSFFEKLQEIEKLQTAIESHGKIPADTLRKVNYKFRLDWNYYSNMIEGNSLTMQETRSIMVGNVTVEGKPLKDVLEMKGHDDVISEILRIGKSELNISEKRIKDIHKGIMHEEDPEKQKLIGIWKTEPNYLYNFKGERFDFTGPADVADAMHKLINWLNAEKEKISRKAKGALHPIQLAFHFHIDYVTIHPFYDGNGRTARIFTNLILVSFGYPPIYVKDTEKDAYNQYLGEIQTYGGDTELFYTFMAGLLQRSMSLTLDALEDRMIDEPNDWQKKLQLLKLENNRDDVQESKSEINVYEIIDKGIRPFLHELLNSLQGFEDLFNTRTMDIKIQNSEGYNIENYEQLDCGIDFFLEKSVLENCFRKGAAYQPIHQLTFNYNLSGFKRAGINTFGAFVTLKWQFDLYKYSLFADINESDNISIKLYHEIYTKEETDYFINKTGNSLYQQIEAQIKKVGN